MVQCLNHIGCYRSLQVRENCLDNDIAKSVASSSRVSSSLLLKSFAKVLLSRILKQSIDNRCYILSYFLIRKDRVDTGVFSDVNRKEIIKSSSLSSSSSPTADSIDAPSSSYSRSTICPARMTSTISAFRGLVPIGKSLSLPAARVSKSEAVLKPSLGSLDCLRKEQITDLGGFDQQQLSPNRRRCIRGPQ